MTQTSAAGGTATSTTTYRYHATGQLASIKNPGGIVDRFYFDNLGRPTTWRTGGASTATADNVTRWSATYNGFDEQTAVSRDGIAVSFTRDAIGRVILRTATNETQTFEWIPPQGIRERARAHNSVGNHETLFDYDPLGRLVSRRENFDGGTTSLSFGYGYDPVGRLSVLRYPETLDSGDRSASGQPPNTGMIIRYNYRNGQVQSISESRPNPGVLWEATERHPLGMLKKANYGSELTSTWAYDDVTLRPESQSTAGTTNTPAPDQEFKFYANGTLGRKRDRGSTRPSGTTARAASSIVRPQARHTGHERHRVGQVRLRRSGDHRRGRHGLEQSPDWSQGENPRRDIRLPRGRAHEYRLATHRIGSRPTQTFVYNARGQVTEVLEGTTVKRKYSWASFGLPSKVEHFGPGLVRTFAYDAFGERGAQDPGREQRSPLRRRPVRGPEPHDARGAASRSTDCSATRA